MQSDLNFMKAQNAQREEHARNLKSMHEENLKIERQKLANERKMQADIDKTSLEQGIKIQEAQMQRRVQEKIDMQRKNADYEKKVALAAMGITRSRDVEKDKLTMLNINRQKLKDEHTHLQNHLKKEIIKTQSTQQLKDDLFKQMQQRRKESQIERSQDHAQLQINKKMDEQHWQNEKDVQEARKQKRLAYEADLIKQIEAKRNSQNGSGLELNQQYIDNIKQIKDLLQEEVKIKESVVAPITKGKKHLGHNVPNAISVVGLHGNKVPHDYASNGASSAEAQPR